MCILGDTLQPAADISSALRHLFRLRKIQANMRRSRESWPCNMYVRHDNSRRSSFKFALDRWRQEIPENAVTHVQCGYLNSIWMQKLYDYSLLILVEGKRDFNETDGTEDVLAAIVDVCRSFRKLQSEGHVMCYTWSAVSVTPRFYGRSCFEEIANEPSPACLPIPSGDHASLYRLDDEKCDWRLESTHPTDH